MIHFTCFGSFDFIWRLWRRHAQVFNNFFFSFTLLYHVYFTSIMIQFRFDHHSWWLLLWSLTSIITDMKKKIEKHRNCFKIRSYFWSKFFFPTPKLLVHFYCSLQHVGGNWTVNVRLCWYLVRSWISVAARGISSSLWQSSFEKDVRH